MQPADHPIKENRESQETDVEQTQRDRHRYGDRDDSRGDQRLPDIRPEMSRTVNIVPITMEAIVIT